MTKLYTKEELIKTMKEIFAEGWHKSIKETKAKRNDGAIGNTLEKLLGIEENNLPIPNASEWELKGQRAHTTSLITLKHMDPSPRGAKIVTKILLPQYGWQHKEAGEAYKEKEMSFRSTTNAVNFTSRGFGVIVDRKDAKVRFVFDASKADNANPEIANWLNLVKERVGLGPLSPEPYWGFKDLEYAIGTKLTNCFYVIAESKIEEASEYFRYQELYILSGFSFDNFLLALEAGNVVVDFDARSGHNHGTKFRLKQNCWKDLYSSVTKAI